MELKCMRAKCSTGRYFDVCLIIKRDNYREYIECYLFRAQIALW